MYIMRERLDNRYHQTECQCVHECRRNIKLTSDSLHRILRQELKAQYQSGNTYRDIYSEQPRPVPHGQYTSGYRRTSGGRYGYHQGINPHTSPQKTFGINNTDQGRIHARYGSGAKTL